MKVTRRLLPRVHWLDRRCYLIYVDGENVGRVWGDRLNARNTLWEALDVQGRRVWLGSTLRECTEHLVRATRATP